jgi:hypothetical protein
MLYRSMLLPGVLWQSVRIGKSLYLALQWVVMSYRLLLPGTRNLHRLDGQIVRGRFHAHLGRFRSHY